MRESRKGGGDLVGHRALAATCDLGCDGVGLMLSEGEEQNGLPVAGELGEFALEVDAAHQRGVVAIGSRVGGLSSGGFVVFYSAALEDGAFLLPVLEAFGRGYPKARTP